MKKPYLLTLLAAGLCGCAGSNRPTPEKCEVTYAASLAACDAILTKPADVSKCHAAAMAIRLACLIAAEPAPTGSKTAAKAGDSKAERWGIAYPALADGSMTPEAFESYVLGGTNVTR